MNVRQVLPPDEIPSVDDPRFHETYDGDAADQMIVLDCDPPRAYPVRYLHFHEVVNDVVSGGDLPDAGHPVAVTWCPLCGSAVVYSRRVGDRELEFGVSGKLADDDLVLYDRETETEWKQSTGEAIDGPLSGDRLRALPAATTTWETFRERHSDGVVLAPPGGRSEAAGEGDDPDPIDYDDGPYREYFESDGYGLEAHWGSGGRDDWPLEDLDPKAVVVGVESGDDALGFPAERIEAADGAVRTTVGDDPVVVFATDDGLFAYRPPFADGFDRVDSTDDRPTFAADGTTWDPVTGESADGRRLARIPVRRLFAFTWRDDHGLDAFWSLDE